MGRLSLNDALEKYKGGGGNDFFTLKDDKETAIVRFLYDTKDIDDLDWFVVHEVEIGGKKRWVLCSQEADCPLCQARNRAQVKLFLQLWHEKDKKVMTWERGRDFVSKLAGVMGRYGSLIRQPYEVERQGKKGDTKTKYELFPLEADNARLDDFPEKQQFVDGEFGFVLDLSDDQMLDCLEGRYTPPKRDVEQPDSPPPRRRGGNEAKNDEPPAKRRDEEQPEKSEQPAERTQRTARSERLERSSRETSSEPPAKPPERAARSERPTSQSSRRRGGSTPPADGEQVF